MPTSSTLFSMHWQRQAEGERRTPFKRKGILFTGLTPAGDMKVPVWVGPPQAQHVGHRARDGTSESNPGRGGKLDREGVWFWRESGLLPPGLAQHCPLWAPPG